MAQGLCYRYFPSKEALFDSAIEQYADVLVEQFAGAEKDDHKTLRQIIEDMPALWKNGTQNIIQFFHGAEKQENSTISFLSKVCEKLVPLVEKIIATSSAKRRNPV